MVLFNGVNIVCFGPSDWWAMNPSCCTHIMKGFAKSKNRILYINPFSSDLLGAVGRKGLGTRLLRKAKSLLKIMRKADDNIFVLSPFFLPLQGINMIDVLNNLLIKIQVRIAIFLLRMNKSLLWIENIRSADVIKGISCRLKIYHASDDFTQCPYTKFKDILIEREDYILKESDLVICVSKQLYKNKKERKQNVHYIPHGVNFGLFRNASENKDEIILSHIKHPIVGYFGTLTAQNDIELLNYCAKKLSKISFVFAGKITAGDYSELMKLPNVNFIGHLPYENIPKLCSEFDVCVMAWKQNKWIESCNPLKLFEYMASGKPIVSIPINEIEQYSDLISLKGTKEDFCKAILWELSNDTEQRKQKRIEIARNNSWDNHIEQISELINQSLKEKQ